MEHYPTRAYWNTGKVLYYWDQRDLYGAIDHFLVRPDLCWGIGSLALEWTRQHHLYRHRVEGLLATVKERLGIS